MITLHHLLHSRSTRVIWLLEELGLEYKLVSYERTPQLRAPPELAKVHPLGKAPIIEDEGRVITESAVILSYINTRYGGGKFAPPPGSDAYWIHEEWLQYAESSAGFPIMMTLVGGMIGGLPERLGGFAKSGTDKTLDYITQGIGKGPCLMGEAFTIADIQMAYLIEVSGYVGLLDARTPLTDYLNRLKQRPAFIKAIEIGGPIALPKT